MDVYVARQPIFDRRKNVAAYELLFRGGIAKNCYEANDGDWATRSVIADSFFVIGLDSLTGGKQAFINFTANMLAREDITVLPKDRVVIEILETVEPNETNLAACRRLKQLGFTLALDDFVFDLRYLPFIELADIIKVDFLASDPAYCKAAVSSRHSGRLRFLAEKVETPEQYELAIDLGYSLFQGYFFSKPVIMSGQEIPTYKQAALRLLQEINRPHIEIEDLEAIIRRDVALTYKLLKFINSSAFGLKSSIRSVKQALALLGKREIIKWLSLLTARTIAADKPNELITASLVKARFGELLAREIGLQNRDSDIFLLGLFSGIDALLDRPMDEIIPGLPLADDIKRALLGQHNIFYFMLQSMDAYAAGNWKAYEEYAAHFSADKSLMPRLYLTALKWVHETAE
ncbi:MAG: HDOD domain-containing protein [Negativicutes bacterium]|nr:HDOD domain-containing protein [Negativicutes bacterium]